MNNHAVSSNEPIVYDGKLGEQYKIFILNVFLGLITLGIYHYWGKTRQRRYTTSSFSIFQDRFEYTGYGGQLFWGMIKALVIILIFSVPLFYAIHTIDKLTKEHPKTEQTSGPSTEKKTKKGFNIGDADEKKIEIDIDKLSPKEKQTYIFANVAMVFYFLFYYAFLPFVAIYGSLRYRITHSRWRGIRGHMNGSSVLYGFVGLFHLFLKIITFGLWIPFADAMTYKYKMNRISFGNQNAVFKPDYGTLFGTHLLSFFGGAFAGIAIGVIVGFMVYGLIPEAHTAAAIEIHEDAPAAIAGFVGMIAFFLCFIMARFWYRAAFVRMRYNALTFGNMGFNCKISALGLFRQTFGNGLILIFTLGLGYPIVIQRKMNFFCKYTTVTGDINNSPILQAIGQQDTAGEGLSSILDISIGLF
ncbi:MAG: DUF898 family protein [Proteobacteria bacterium]|nr:DUF898 family protein [Pseudomonadota bacterium]